MILDMKRLFDVTDEQEEFSFDIGTDELKERVFSVVFASPLAVSGRAYNRAGIVNVDLKCVFTLAHVCDRCLAEFEREYSFEFSHVCMRDHSSNDEHIIVKDNALDLNDLAISDSLLQLPTKILCREDCRGLCYVCGQNLNEGECNCS
ncbi:uncharacterized protein SAMN02910317_02237 [Ruminococcaceae bacterium FB2012]|nr:uncharacterized protein SAMN02910317_02237 [Ruminococcaceae bacterium FB2012]